MSNTDALDGLDEFQHTGFDLVINGCRVCTTEQVVKDGIVSVFYSLRDVVRSVDKKYTYAVRDLTTAGLSGTMHGNPVTDIDIFGAWWICQKYDAGMAFGFYHPANCMDGNNCCHNLDTGGHIVEPFALHRSQVKDAVWPVYSLKKVLEILPVRYQYYHRIRDSQIHKKFRLYITLLYSGSRSR